MADNNRNTNRSFYGSDENREDYRDRYGRENDYSQSNYKDVNYNAQGDMEGTQGYDSNRSYGNRADRYNDRNNDYGGRENRYGDVGNSYENKSWRNDNRPNYTNQNRDDEYYGGYNSNYGGNYGSSENYQSTNRNNRQNQGWRTEGDYGTRYGNDQRYGNTNYGRGRSDNRGGSIYGGDTSNFGNANQGGVDRGWFDKTVDKVSSWFGDDDAERRVERDRNTDRSTGLHRGKGPKGYQRSDERIKEDVCDRLSDHPMIDASNIDIKVEGSEVILTGTVDSKEDKRRAEDIAESISGVKNVQNQIRVEHSNRDSLGSRNRW